MRLVGILEQLSVLFMLLDRACIRVSLAGRTWPAFPFANGAGHSPVYTIEFGRGLGVDLFGVPLGVVERLRTRVLRRLLDRGVILGLRIILVGV